MTLGFPPLIVKDTYVPYKFLCAWLADCGSYVWVFFDMKVFLSIIFRFLCNS